MDLLLTTRWLIPLNKWVITLVVNGRSRVSPLTTGVITLLSKWDEPPSILWSCNGLRTGRLFNFYAIYKYIVNLAKY